MKKLALFLLVIFVITSLASMALARTLEEEKQAVRAYLKVVDAKIIKYRTVGNTDKVTMLQAEKAATLKRWYKIKAQMEAEKTAPVKETVVVVRETSASEGLFGLGIKSAISGIYTYCNNGIKGTIAVRGDILLDDPFMLGSYVGLADNAVMYKGGLGFVYGNDINDNAIKAIPVYGDVVVSIPVMDLDTYVTGGLNYVVYGSDRVAGAYGVQGGVGLMYDLGLGLGKTGFEVGYNAVRAGENTRLSAKGISVTVSQPFVL